MQMYYRLLKRALLSTALCDASWNKAGERFMNENTPALRDYTMCVSIWCSLAGEKCCKELILISSPTLPLRRATREPCAEPADKDVAGTSPAYLNLPHPAAYSVEWTEGLRSSRDGVERLVFKE